MEFYFVGSSKVVMEHHPGDAKSKHVRTDIILDVSPGMDKKKYFDKEGLPTDAAIKPITIAFVQGLVANMHNAHQKGWWDSAEHLRYIITELERGFAEVATVSKGTF